MATLAALRRALGLPDSLAEQLRELVTQLQTAAPTNTTDNDADDDDAQPHACATDRAAAAAAAASSPASPPRPRRSSRGGHRTQSLADWQIALHSLVSLMTRAQHLVGQLDGLHGKWHPLDVLAERVQREHSAAKRFSTRADAVHVGSGHVLDELAELRARIRDAALAGETQSVLQLVGDRNRLHASAESQMLTSIQSLRVVCETAEGEQASVATRRAEFRRALDDVRHAAGDRLARERDEAPALDDLLAQHGAVRDQMDMRLGPAVLDAMEASAKLADALSRIEQYAPPVVSSYGPLVTGLVTHAAAIERDMDREVSQRLATARQLEEQCHAAVRQLESTRTERALLTRLLHDQRATRALLDRLPRGDDLPFGSPPNGRVAPSILSASVTASASFARSMLHGPSNEDRQRVQLQQRLRDLEGIIQELARNAHPELLLTSRQTALTGLLTGSEYFAFHRAAEVIARAIVRARVAKRAHALAAMARTRRRLLLEVVDTELRFCAHTATIIKRYQVPMAALEGMDARAHATMFPRALAAIHDLAARTCSLLSATPHAVIDVFVSQVPAYADAFQPFCDAYADASAAVRSAAAAGSKSKVAAFLEKEARTGLPLDQLLVMPVQRVPRLELLFQNVLKETPALHPERPQIVQLLASLQHVCAILDTGVENVTRRRQMQQIAASIAMFPRSLVDGRRCLLQGRARVLSLPCTLVLSDDLLFVCQADVYPLVYAGAIALGTVDVVGGEARRVDVVHGAGSSSVLVALEFDGDAEARKWRDALQRSCQLAADERHAKELADASLSVSRDASTVMYDGDAVAAAGAAPPQHVLATPVRRARRMLAPAPDDTIASGDLSSSLSPRARSISPAAPMPALAESPVGESSDAPASAMAPLPAVVVVAGSADLAHVTRRGELLASRSASASGSASAGSTAASPGVAMLQSPSSSAAGGELARGVTPPVAPASGFAGRLARWSTKLATLVGTTWHGSPDVADRENSPNAAALTTADRRALF